jgi:hypothetical protein
MTLERHAPPLPPRKIFPFRPGSTARILADKLTHVRQSLPAARLAWPAKYRRLIATGPSSPAPTCPRKRMIPNQMQKSAHLVENKRSQTHCSQSLAHSLSLFSRKSFVCRSYAKHTRGCTPLPPRSRSHNTRRKLVSAPGDGDAGSRRFDGQNLRPAWIGGHPRFL